MMGHELAPYLAWLALHRNVWRERVVVVVVVFCLNYTPAEAHAQSRVDAENQNQNRLGKREVGGDMFGHARS